MDVGFIGTGSMGSLLIRSLVRYGALRPGAVWAANRTPAKLERLASEVPGVHPAPAREVVRRCPLVFLCVKPGETGAALEEVGDDLTPDHLLVILSNMLPLEAVEARTTARVAKVIPSLAHQVGGGVALIMYGNRVRPADRQRLERLLAPIARPLVIREHQGRTAADITSCGPAFLACVLQAMARAAAEAQPDLPLPVAEALVRETALATARLLAEDGMTFDEVIARISVPGGITAEAVRLLAEQVPAAWEAVFRTTREVEEEKRRRLRL